MVQIGGVADVVATEVEREIRTGEQERYYGAVASLQYFWLKMQAASDPSLSCVKLCTAKAS
jgi:hypothetical protein